MKTYQKAVTLLLLIVLVLSSYGCKETLNKPEKDMLTLKYKLTEDE